MSNPPNTLARPTEPMRTLGSGPAAQPRHRGWHYQILKSAFELGRPGRSADPDSHIAPTAQEPPPAAIIVVVGISAEATKAAAEMGDVMEAAQVTDSVESAADVADAVKAAMARVHRRDRRRPAA